MKILVFSDTHGSPDEMISAVESTSNIIACFFLGDGGKDADTLQNEFPSLPLYRVRGNCDFASFDPLEGLASFEGLLFFYTHGHQYNVKSSLKELYQTAYNSGAAIALFGHTHMPYYKNYNGLHLFNPGSLSLPRVRKGSYGIITLEKNEPRFEHCYLSE